MKGDSYRPFTVIKNNSNNNIFPEVTVYKFKNIKTIIVPEFLWENIKKKLKQTMPGNVVKDFILTIFPGIFVSSIVNIIFIGNLSTMMNTIYWCMLTSSLIGTIFYIEYKKTRSKTIEAKLDEVNENIKMVEELIEQKKHKDETSANNEAS